MVIYICMYVYAHILVPDNRELSTALPAVDTYACMHIYLYGYVRV